MTARHNKRMYIVVLHVYVLPMITALYPSRERLCRILCSLSVFMPCSPLKNGARDTRVRLWLSLCVPKTLWFVNTSQKPMKWISPNFGHLYVWIHRCAQYCWLDSGVKRSKVKVIAGECITIDGSPPSSMIHLHVVVVLFCCSSQNSLDWPRRIKSVQCHPGLTYIFNFWHSGTLALRAERQSARMSEIKNVG